MQNQNNANGASKVNNAAKASTAATSSNATSTTIADATAMTPTGAIVASESNISSTLQLAIDPNQVHEEHRRTSIVNLNGPANNQDDDAQRLLLNGPNPQTNDRLPNFPLTPRDVQIAPPGGLSSNLDFLADISAHQTRTEPEMNPIMMDEQAPPYFGWGDVPALDPTEAENPQRPISFDPMPNEMLQLWLEPRADSISHHSSSIELMRNMNFLGENFISAARRNSRSLEPGKASDDIPNERFVRVERCWLAPTDQIGRLINTLWRDVSCYDADNLFSIPTWQSMSPSSGNYPGSRFGLDEECRLQLQHAFGLSPTSLANFNNYSPNDASSPAASTTMSGSIPAFPPAEILDMALDLYFRHFHPLVPFVHMATFCAKKTQLPLLFVMCQIGMIILGTKGTTSFVLKTFACSVERITSDLAKCAVGNDSAVGIMATFAAAFLTLNLAAMTGVSIGVLPINIASPIY